jgi:predicted metal-dependent HD superfamily phosphohydrolase
MHYDQAYSLLIEKLERELSPDLTYHNPGHTRSVIEATQLLCELEKLDEHNTQLLITAALFHDAGFIRSYHEHEEKSCELAKEYLPEFGYNEEDIQAICKMIMATKLPQQPTDIFQSIICDADLHYLGTDNYFPIAEHLYQEYKKLDIVKSRADWKKMQIQFFNTHRYFTRSAKEKYDKEKQENFRVLSREDDPPEKKGYLSTLKDIFFVLVVIVIAGLALKVFLAPHNFPAVGVSAIFLLTHEIDRA